MIEENNAQIYVQSRHLGRMQRMNKTRQLFKIHPALTGIRATTCMLQCLFRVMRIGSVQDKQQQSSSEPLVTPDSGYDPSWQIN